MNQPAPCPICDRQQSGFANSDCPIYADSHWLVRHARETNILGYLVLEARRHFLDLAEASERECRSYGPVLATVVRAVRDVIPCERVYTFTLAEMVPHFHVHVIPRTAAMPRAFRGRGILSYPLLPCADPVLVGQTCDRMRRSVRRQASSGLIL